MHLTKFPSFHSNAVIDGFSCLKPREWKILVLIVNDFTNSEIMNALNLKRRTILNLRNSIGDKLGLKDEHTLAIFASANRDVILFRYNLYRAKSGNQAIVLP
ncbi:LuxR C-terminal-related transcriptional regulator [Dyadobacter sp. CY323]|uniref:LuxR C-terminal-related transcriptional regulator n=1 Tax=Dyadobacter sp. CY323 TaxID=2907302 RepID=UPI001F426454|nr:LuxR C-terminal-related transcriptional regulator [Dyadobacter sp. CY323]MCE6988703.1 LuxR C-terminal-related transcriptional regulator [Dyadobacter sp. CY323]